MWGWFFIVEREENEMKGGGLNNNKLFFIVICTMRKRFSLFHFYCVEYWISIAICHRSLTCSPVRIFDILYEIFFSFRAQ